METVPGSTFKACFSASSRSIYKRRKTKVELVFGHTKKNLKTDSFPLRGLEGVAVEISILATCFNITRAIVLFGVQKLIDAFKQAQMVPA
ncbi:MAG: transposase [Deltaproteobacteria bacterium]|nr:transposase [Deltaproteobacteria bacterium]